MSIIAGQYQPFRREEYVPVKIDFALLSDRLQKQEQMFSTMDDALSKHPNYLSGDKEDRDKLVKEFSDMRSNVVGAFEQGNMLQGNKKLYSAVRDVSASWKEGGKAYAMQSNYSAAQAWQKEQRERLEKKEITQYQYAMSVKDSLDGFKTFGPNGEINSFSGRSRAQYIDPDKYMMERLPLYKADLEEKYGPPQRIAGKLVFMKEGLKTVREEDILESLRDSWLAAARQTGQLDDEFRFKRESGVIDVNDDEVISPFAKKVSNYQASRAVFSSAKTPQEQLKALDAISDNLGAPLSVDSENFIKNKKYRDEVLKAVDGLIKNGEDKSKLDYDAAKEYIDAGKTESLVHKLWEKDVAETFARPYAEMGSFREKTVDMEITNDIYEEFKLKYALQERKAELQRNEKLFWRKLETAEILDRPVVHGPVLNETGNPALKDVGALALGPNGELKLPGSGLFGRYSDKPTAERADAMFELWARTVAPAHIKDQIRGWVPTSNPNMTPAEKLRTINEGGSNLNGAMYHQNRYVNSEFVKWFNNQMTVQRSTVLEGNRPAMNEKESQAMGNQIFSRASNSDIFMIDEDNNVVPVTYEQFASTVTKARQTGGQNNGPKDQVTPTGAAPVYYQFAMNPLQSVLPAGDYVTVPGTDSKGNATNQRFIIGTNTKARQEAYKPVHEMYQTITKNPRAHGVQTDVVGNIYVYKPAIQQSGKLGFDAQVWRRNQDGTYSPLKGTDQQGRPVVDQSIKEDFSSIPNTDKKARQIFETYSEIPTFSERTILSSIDESLQSDGTMDETSRIFTDVKRKNQSYLTNRYTYETTGLVSPDQLQDLLDE
jgi:hypothetical protein